MAIVSLVHCESYEPRQGAAALQKVLEPLGGMDRFVRPGARVLLKPNLLSARAPEKRVTTDPAIVRTVANMVREAGGHPFIGDSPGIEPFKRVIAKTGMKEIAGELGIDLVELSDPRRVTLPDGSLFRNLEIASQALDADVVINLPKLKTHTQMLMTLGVKNLFGTIVAQRKTEWHYMTGLNRDAFASLLLHIYQAVRPAVTILDGVWGMEGDGPGNGDPRQLNLVAAAQDAVALDMTICRILNIPLESFPLYRAARAGGIGETSPERIEVQGGSLESFRIPGFQVPELDSLRILPGIFDGFAKRYLVSKPVQNAGTCAGCGECVEACPADAIELVERRLHFDYDACIRCYCCQEICPRGAIGFRKGLLLRILNRFHR
ncbi:MAG: DUF362 domain-containing protein [Deltaproteobacteria bacterium]|nr:DUF362 domain-containing protein [Deltaproteobacteria bacterium]